MQLRKEAWKKKFRTATGFEPVTSRFTGAMLYQLSYEATDVGSRPIVGSYAPVKEMSVNEMSVNDIWKHSRSLVEIQMQTPLSGTTLIHQ